MIKLLSKTFLKGLLTLLPVTLSIYLLIWVLRGLETLTNNLLLWFLPDFLYVPGMGILIGILLIIGLGLLMEFPLARYVHEKVETPFTTVPLVKSMYFAIKDLTAFVVPSEGKKGGQVVTIRMPDSQMNLMGILTRSDTHGLPEDLNGKVAVYLPMSYQIGGIVVFVPVQNVTHVDMNVEAFMRQVLTAWMPTSNSARRR